MSEKFPVFKNQHSVTLLDLPFDLDRFISDWTSLRTVMIRNRDEHFSRDEWAYLISFLGETNLTGIYESSFGERCPGAAPLRDGEFTLRRPRGRVALWLPNNVSLLGPLMLILISLSGCPIRMKSGSRAENLTGIFLDYARKNVSDGPLRQYLVEQIEMASMGHDDPRVREWAASSAVRLFFGGDAASQAIESMPHPVNSRGFYFHDRVSQAWVSPACVTDDLLTMVIRVLAVYGQAGCTAPKRLVLIDATPEEARSCCDRLGQLWPKVVPRLPMPYQASMHVMLSQWAAMKGWGIRTAANNAAVFASGELSLPLPEDHAMFLPVSSAPLEEAVSALPVEIQTIGTATRDPGQRAAWIAALADSGASRIVSLERMHFFGAVWDGDEFWRGLFINVEVG